MKSSAEELLAGTRTRSLQEKSSDKLIIFPEYDSLLSKDGSNQ